MCCACGLAIHVVTEGCSDDLKVHEIVSLTSVSMRLREIEMGGGSPARIRFTGAVTNFSRHADARGLRYSIIRHLAV